MANRSYLYSINQEENGKISKAFDISEQKYDLPIIYKILTSVNTEIIDSPIFKNAFALKGDATRGRKRLNAFFKKLHNVNIFDEKELSKTEDELQEHLDKYTLDYFLFDPTEVLLMECEDEDDNEDGWLDDDDYILENACSRHRKKLENKTKQIVKEVASYEEMIDDFIDDFLSLGNIDYEYWETLGIYASTYLYYSLGDEAEVEMIEKSFDNAKYTKIQALIAEKPTVKLYLSLIREISYDWDSSEGRAQRSEIIEKALKLEPNFEELKDLIHFCPDPKRRLEIIEQTRILYPDKEEETYYWKYEVYEKLGMYREALDYYIKDLIAKNNPLDTIYGLNDLIKECKLDALEVYLGISKKVKIKRVEVAVIDELINKDRYDEALKYFRQQQEFLADDPTADFREDLGVNRHIVNSYLLKDQLSIAIELAQEFNEEVCVSNYYFWQKDYAKSIFYFMKQIDNQNPNAIVQLNYSITEGLEKFIDGELANENIEISEIFSDVYRNIKEFKKETIKKVSDDLLKEAKKYSTKVAKDLHNVARKLLILEIRT